MRYYSNTSLKYFSDLMRAGYFNIEWICHETCMPIENKSIDMALGRTSVYHKRYTCNCYGLNDKYEQDHNICTCQQHLKQG